MGLLDDILATPTSQESRIVERGGELFLGGVNLTRIISEGEIKISAEDWSALNAEHDHQSIIFAISAAIAEFKLPLPFKEVTEEDATRDYMRLVAFPVDELLKVGKCSARVEGQDIGRYFLENEVVGKDASNHFHQRSRLRCSYAGLVSPAEMWETRKGREYFLRALWSLKYQSIGTRELRSAISLRGYVAPQFPPLVAKFFIEKFGARSVLDFCAGWGDRLCGAYASSASRYLGIDPNTSLHNDYERQRALYSQISGEKDFSVICDQAEKFTYGAIDKVDLIITSPPYFDRERYCEEDTQSYNQYKTPDDWLAGFLFESISRSYNYALNDGGFLVLNISDIWDKYKKQFVTLCEPTNRFIASLPGAEYLGCVNFKINKRPMSKGETVEPCWIWRKNTGQII